MNFFTNLGFKAWTGETLESHRGYSFRVLFLADTHLGYDAPLRPVVQRRRRGDDFFSNYLKALQPALTRKVDLVLHGGDLFFRSRIHPVIVQAAFEPLLQIADLGIPVFIIPGNHERSNIPRSLLNNHPGIVVFDRPQTHVLTLQGCRLALVGFANIRQNPRLLFKRRLEEAAWRDCEAEIRFLCMHQTLEGAQVGVQNYTFREGNEVIRGCDIPSGFDAVLCGHIHRHQILTKCLNGKKINAPVYYPGAIERTSFAERNERKGYLLLTIQSVPNRRIDHQFVLLDTRPMIDLVITSRGLSLAQAREWLIQQIRSLDANAIVRVRTHEQEAESLIKTLNDRWLRSIAPKSMNINWSHRWRHNEGSPTPV